MPRDLPVDLTTPLIPPSLSHHAITLEKWSTQNSKYYKMAVGALIFRLSPTNTSQVLLLKRADTDSYPGVWEPPGGSVDPEDKTLLDAVVREVWEETGLRVKGFGAQVWHKIYRKGDEIMEVEFLGRTGGKWCKLNFLVDVVAGDEVRIDLEEHQDCGWFGRAEFEKLLFVSEQGRNIIRNGFTAFQEAEKEKAQNGSI